MRSFLLALYSINTAAMDLKTQQWCVIPHISSDSDISLIAAIDFFVNVQSGQQVLGGRTKCSLKRIASSSKSSFCTSIYARWELIFWPHHWKWYWEVWQSRHVENTNNVDSHSWWLGRGAETAYLAAQAEWSSRLKKKVCKGILEEGRKSQESCYDAWIPSYSPKKA